VVGSLTSRLEQGPPIWPQEGPATFVDVLGRWAFERPEQLALSFVVEGTTEIERLTYGELDRRARTIAGHLGSQLQPGDRALLLFPPTLEFVSAFFGCLYAGVLAVPAYPPSPRTVGRLLAIVRDAEPATVLTSSSIGPMVRAGLMEYSDFGSIPVIETDLLEEGIVRWEPPEIDGATVAFLQYTSGSVGTPKGVMVHHAALLHDERMISRAFGTGDDLVGVSWLPLYHDMGLIGQVLQPVFLGARSYLMSPIEFLKRPVTWLRAVTHFRANTSGGPNFGYERCVRKITQEDRRSLDLSSWKVAYNGAEPLRAETFQRFAETFAECGFRAEALYPCYGLAEATLLVTGKPSHEAPTIRSFDIAALENEDRAVPSLGPGSRALVSSGRPWIDQRIVIVDPVAHTEREPGRVGEIWVAGGNLAAGYWKRPVESEEVFGARLAGSDGQAFMRTGDLGFVLDGELYVTGRIKDLIIIRGRNFYPQDIERTVEEADPHVRAGCGAAFGIEVEGEERLVVVTEVEENGETLDVDTVLEAIRLSVVTTHQIRAHVVVLVPRGEIPKTSSGKLQRALTRQRYLDGSLSVLAESVRLR
jgi:acyl-CoA synthetase (AMP-forming)/AMP-acid ligase II